MWKSCCSEYQRYKLLKAIHNTIFGFSNKIELLRISKIQTFESNSQPNSCFSFIFSSCSEYQRYKLLKAIHNLIVSFTLSKFVAQNIKDTNFWKQFTTRVFPCIFDFLLLRISKIQTFESNSQLSLDNLFRLMVAQNIKDTNFWKQFTTFYFFILW